MRPPASPTTIRSLPVPPDRMSLAPPPRTRSSPAPPSMKLVPGPAVISSSPSPPWMMFTPAPPVITSRPLLPKTSSRPAPGRRRVALPRPGLVPFAIAFAVEGAVVALAHADGVVARAGGEHQLVAADVAAGIGALARDLDLGVAVQRVDQDRLAVGGAA